jgi:tRNA (guanine37-N1)-methyltransferase
MQFVIATIFPEMFEPFLSRGIVGRAVDSGIISAGCINIRDFATDKHQMTDDRLYGGGCGMVMKPEPLAGAVRAAAAMAPGAPRVLLSPQGRVLDQRLTGGLAAENGLILICGRYEGTDERIASDLVDLEVSIGDFVLSGGETAAMVIIDAVTRLIPGALGGPDSAAQDSFTEGLLEHAQYTRPRSFEGEDVPDVLLSGNHGAIEKWRRESSLLRTLVKRPDLFENRALGPDDIAVLKKWHSRLSGILSIADEGD